MSDNNVCFLTSPGRNKMTKTLQLSDTLLLGKGRDRACYRHPDNDDMCIKVALRPEKQTRREKAYFRYLKQQGRDLSLLTPYLGTINTNLGPGALYPRVYNADGSESYNLTEAIRKNLLDDNTIDTGIRTLKQYLLDNCICVRDISPSNIMCRRTEKKIVFIIVDGVTNPGINPLNIRLRALVRKSINEAWFSLEAKINRLRQEHQHSSEK